MDSPCLSFGALRILVIPVTPFQQNCLLLWHDKTRRGAVLDPGGDAPRIMAAIYQTHAAIDKIVLTHGHLDHAGGVGALQDALMTPESSQPESGQRVDVVGPHRADQFLLDDLPGQGRMFGLENPLSPVAPDRWLDEGDTLEIAGYPFDVRHCPGHTPGHVVFLQPDLKLALVGDVLFQGSIGRTDFPYGHSLLLLRAIREKLLCLPDDTVFLCGHGPGSSIGEERRNNPFLR